MIHVHVSQTLMSIKIKSVLHMYINQHHHTKLTELIHELKFDNMATFGQQAMAMQKSQPLCHLPLVTFFLITFGTRLNLTKW